MVYHLSPPSHSILYSHPSHQSLVVLVANYHTDVCNKCCILTTEMYRFAPTLTLLQLAYGFYSPLHPFTVKSHCSSHWYRVIRLVALGQQSGRGLGLARPVIRVQLNPLCLCSIAPVMGCYRSRSPWDFITHTKIDKPDTLNGREGLALDV